MSVPGRLLLQNGEPLSEYNEQLHQCRKLRSADQKQCTALVGSVPCIWMASQRA
jgi:hypothetical protein